MLRFCLAIFQTTKLVKFCVILEPSKKNYVNASIFFSILLQEFKIDDEIAAINAKYCLFFFLLFTKLGKA